MMERVRTLLADADAKIGVESLLKIVLALLVILLALEVIEELFAFATGLLNPLLTLVILVLVALWLLGRL